MVVKSTPSVVGCRMAACLSSQPSHLRSCIDALAGEWGDDIGLRIHVKGNQAWFSDGTGPWPFEAVDGALMLRGARLVGVATAPHWQFPNGVERFWARLEAAGSGNAAWAETLFAYKGQRLQLRIQMQAAFAKHDFDKVTSLRAAWEQVQCSQGASEAQNRALDVGRNLVPGVCFRHTKFDYRGVILGCDAWCSYPTAWRAKWVPNRPQGESQPFYYCAVDERDRPGRQSRYVAEENIELCEFVFPVQAALVDMLFVRCDQLGGYLPGHHLSQVLHSQRYSGKFSL